MVQADGIPPSLFWESDVGKWWVRTVGDTDGRIEGACYFLASEDGRASPHAAQFDAAFRNWST